MTSVYQYPSGTFIEIKQIDGKNKHLIDSDYISIITVEGPKLIFYVEGRKIILDFKDEYIAIIVYNNIRNLGYGVDVVKCITPSVITIE